MAMRPTVSTMPPMNDGPSKRLHGTGSGLTVVVMTGAGVVVDGVVVVGVVVVGAVVDVVGFVGSAVVVDAN